MRALGAKERQVARLFLIEVLVLALIGSLAGIAAGTGLSLSLSRSFAILKNLPVDINALTRIEISAAGLLFGTVICCLGALFPLRRLRKLEPLLVIKQE